MARVTGDEVKAAMIAAGVVRVDRQMCANCNHPLFYSRDGEQLYYNSGCSQTGGDHGDPHLFSWQDAADWINFTKDPVAKAEIAAKFGFTIGSA